MLSFNIAYENHAISASQKAKQQAPDQTTTKSVTFWGKHKNLYFIKYMVLSLISSTSKILDIVLFWECAEYLTCVSGFVGILIVTADHKGDLVSDDENCVSQAWNGETPIEGILWFRFFATFTFGFVMMLLLPCFFCYYLWYHDSDIAICLWLVCLIGPIIVITKLVVIFARLISIPFYYLQIAKLKDTDKKYIPDILQIYWMAQLGLPETLLSGPLLLVITIYELFSIPLSGQDITIRICKVVLGLISLIVALKDSKLVYSKKLWFWKRISQDWNLDEGKCGEICLKCFAVLLVLALGVYVIVLARTSQ